MVGLKSVLIGMKYNKNREATSRYTFEGDIHELGEYLEYLQQNKLQDSVSGELGEK